MKRRLAWFSVVILLASSPTFIASAAVKAGGTCTKLKATTISNGYKYTCIKSGKKLVWSKGVKVVVKATPSPTASATPTQTPIPSATPTPSPSPTPIATASPTVSASPTPTPSPTVSQVSEPALPKPGDDCPTIGKKIVTSYGFIRCDFFGGSTIKWREHRIPVLSNTKSNNYKVTPVVGESCSQSGDTYDISGGYLECRYVNGGKLFWMKINTVKNTFSNALSPSGTDVCRLKNADIDESKLPENTRGGVRDPHIAAGFPTIPRPTWKSPGTQKALVVGVDFPELRGNDSDLKAINERDKKIHKEWYSYFSNNTFNYELTTIDYWFHAPKSAKSYSVNPGLDSRTSDGNAIHDAVNQEMIDLITKDIDLTPFTTIYIIFPDGEVTLDRDWVTRNRTYKTKEGTKNFNIFGWGKDNELMGTPRWAYYIHEVLHDAPLIGHAPGSGWPFSIMAQQSGISESPLAWEQFQLDWLPDNQIFCVDKESLTRTEVSLTPIEREDKQTKMAVIKLSKTQALVIESHGIDKWSSFNWNDRSYPGGFYGVMAYIVDIQNAVAPPVSADGRAISDDTGNDPKYPRWAYWQKIDGGASFLADFDFRSGSEPYNGYIAVLGDTFTIQGVKVKLISAGDYETISIEKVG